MSCRADQAEGGCSEAPPGGGSPAVAPANPPGAPRLGRRTQDLLRGEGLSPRRAELASVDGVALRIGERAALVPEPGSRVHGVVVSLTLTELERLYSDPSVQAYEPQAVLARLATGGVVAALCYNLPGPPSPGERNPEYATKLRAVAEKVGLPPDYVASLDAGLTAGRNAMTSTIRFYFDYESPNAYLAWTQLPKLAGRHGCTVDPVPVLYAALLDAHGQLGPGELPAKGRWMSKNMARKAALLGVPLSPPAFLPFNPLLALRTTLLASQTAERDALIGALFRAVWVHGLHVSDAAVVERVANDVGLPGAALVAQTQKPEVKEQLRLQTDEAISRGVFGVPSMEVGDELFWGYDDFPFLELFLAGKDPVDVAEWRKPRPPVQASSVRRQFRSAKDGA